LNTVVNPLLYGVLSENFRKCFTRLWFGGKISVDNNGCGRTGHNSKSHNDALNDYGARSNGVSGTPSSGHVTGCPQGTPPKFHKKTSTCSVGSIMENPSGAQQV
jgi:hypothetical protein